MSQFPHDEFDDVPPYTKDEVGKHRAPGTAATAAAGGGMKWVALLAVFVLAIAAAAYFIVPLFADEDESTAEETDNGTEQTEEQPEGEGEDDAEGEGGEGENGEENGNGEGSGAEADSSFPITVYNFDGPEGTAGAVGSQLEAAGYTDVSLENWNPDWQTCGESTPVVVHPTDQESLGAEIAEQIGASTCSSQGWDEAGLVAVVVGPESAP